MQFSSTDNYHEFYPQFTRKTVGSRRTTRDQVGSIPINWTCNRSERVEPQPFAVTLYQKAPRAFYVLLAGGFVDLSERKPRHLRQIVMNGMVVVVQDQLMGERNLTGRDWAAAY
jgi:hypothetical protein